MIRRLHPILTVPASRSVRSALLLVGLCCTALIASAQSTITLPPPGSAPTVTDPPPISASTNPTSPALGGYAQREDVKAFAAGMASRHPEWSETAVLQTLSVAQFQPSVTRLIMPPASPGAKNWAAYRQRMVDPLRIKAGRVFSERHAATLRRAEARWGVPAYIIAGIIGVETIYGRNTGNYRALDALATLAFDFPSGRSDRSAFFKDELEALLMLASRERAAATDFLGSYAGALGLPQFMPSSWLKYAVDFDGDGRIDLLRSPEDAIGSVARYLAEAGNWKPGQPTHYLVNPPLAEPQAMATLLKPDILPTFNAQQFTELGAGLDDVARQHPGKLALIELRNGLELPPTYVAGTENFYAITRYNWSAYYAMSVIELGQSLLTPATTLGSAP